jgi:hypothetical protein
MRYMTIDRCSDPQCQCDDRRGIILYDGPSLTAAECAKQMARYPDPKIETLIAPRGQE